jgi:hypothetical protein
MESLADVVHAALCGDGKGVSCKRYARGSGDPHYDFYQARETVLNRSLEPVIGSANVAPVVRIILDELI